VLEDWANFAVITGSAAGALTGLLFVAVSLNRDRIVGHAGLRAEAGQTLGLFILALLLTVILVIPGMSATTLGVVLVAVSLVAGAVLSLIDRHQQRPDRGKSRGRPPARDGGRAKFSDLSAEDQLYRLLDVVSPNLFSVLCVTIAGCLQLAGGDGLYWLAAAVLVALGGGVVNAWLFLTRAPAVDAPEGKKAKAAEDAQMSEDDGVAEDAG
jgi:modulator of FtsH protease